MDFQRFRIDPRLLEAAKGFRSQAFFHEKMLTHVLEANENVCAKIVMSEGREEVYLFPVMQRLASNSAEEQKKALIVIPDSKVAILVLQFCRSIGSAVGFIPARLQPRFPMKVLRPALPFLRVNHRLNWLSANRRPYWMPRRPA